MNIILERVGDITAINVREGNGKPVQCSDGFFWRQGEMTQKLIREEIPEYPIPSIREAITNAVMHREWFNEGSNVFVEISTDHIIISNPGGLPPGMQQSDLGHRSVTKNPIIADLFHRIGFIEKAGTGIRRMREGARGIRYPEPELKVMVFPHSYFYR